MTDSVVYNVLENGSDNAAIGGLVVYVLLAGFFGYLALTFRYLRAKGVSLASRSAQTFWLRTALAKNAVPVILALGLIGIVFAFLVWNRYLTDRTLLSSGRFQSISGTLDEYRATQVWRNGRRGLLDDTPGFQPTFHERDRLVVAGQSFFVKCDKPPDTTVASVGEAGKCLDLRPGQQVRIDFVQVSPTQYRVEPLRITVIR